MKYMSDLSVNWAAQKLRFWVPFALHASAAGYLQYKGFPTFASNISPWVNRAAMNPGVAFSLVCDQFPASCMQRVDAFWQTVRTA